MTVKDLAGKYVFWDVDGVLAEFRFCGKFHPNLEGAGALTQKMVDEGVFESRAPIKSFQRLMKVCDTKGHYVLGGYRYEGEREHKQPWIKEHYPEVKECIWVSGHNYKVDVLVPYLMEHNICEMDAVFIDDTYEELYRMERSTRVTCYHVSSLLDWEEN